MRKQLLFVLIIGVIVVLISFYLNNEKNSDDSDDNSVFQDSIKSDGNISEEVENSNIKKNDLSKLNGEENPDDYKFEELLKNYFEAERRAILDNDVAYMYDFIEKGSKYEKDLIEKINSLSNSNSEYIIEYVLIDNIRKNDNEYVVKAQISMDSVQQFLECNLLESADGYTIKKMILYNNDMDILYEIG